MKPGNRQLDKVIHQIMDEPLTTPGYEPSGDFVNNVMNRLEADVKTGHLGRYVKFLFRIAASIAVVFFIANVLVLISSLKSTDVDGEIVQEWTDTNTYSEDWYEYYSENITGK